MTLGFGGLGPRPTSCHVTEASPAPPGMPAAPNMSAE